MKDIRQIAKKGSKRLATLGVVGSVLVIVGYAVAALLLTQTVPAGSAAYLVSTSCTGAPTPLTANASFYVQGITTYIRFTCTTDGHGYETKGSIVATPTFTLPSPFTQLWSYESSTAAGGTCSAGTGAWQMTSGSSHSFPAGVKDWDYCGLIPNTGSGDWISFTVAWSA